MLSKLKDIVFVFDLDDTLYDEYDYVYSGITYICRKLGHFTRKHFHPNILGSVAEGGGDWLSLLCQEAGLPPSVKTSLLWMYRLHQPTIRLSAACSKMLAQAEIYSKAVLILTDGRSLTQRLKIEALGLSHIPLFISEDYGSEKPDPLRFQIIEKYYPAKLHVYIGDNPNKDFYAPNALGWHTVGVKSRRRPVHSYDLVGLLPDAAPRMWIDDWEKFLENLC